MRKTIKKAMITTIVETMICTEMKRMMKKDTIKSKKMSNMSRNNHLVLKSLMVMMSTMIMHPKIKTTSTM